MEHHREKSIGLVESSSNRKVKLLIIGAPGVGKSSIIRRFMDDIFSDYFIPNSSTSYKKTKKILDEFIDIEIVDIEGQTERPDYITERILELDIDGFILCFSVESQHSYNLIEVFNKKLIEVIGREIPKLLVANKTDISNKRVISTQQGQQLADTIGAGFIECSAKSSSNIQRLIHMILMEIQKYEKTLDIKKICCGSILACFYKRLRCFQGIYLSLIGIEFGVSLCFLVYGFYVGIFESYVDYKALLIFLLYGLWSFIFNIVGIVGYLKKRRDLTKTYMISLIVSLIVILAVFIMIFFDLDDEGKHNYKISNSDGTFTNVSISDTLKDYLIIGTFFFHSILLFFAHSFYRVFSNEYYSSL